MPTYEGKCRDCGDFGLIYGWGLCPRCYANEVTDDGEMYRHETEADNPGEDNL